MRQRGVLVHVCRCRHETTAAFVRGQPACLVKAFIDRLPGPGLFAAQLRHVIPLDHFVTGVVFCAEKDRVLWYLQATLRQQAAHFSAIGHGGEHACIGAAVTATACATVVGSHVRIILAR